MLDPERIIDRLHTGLPFEAHPAELCERVRWRSGIGQAIRLEFTSFINKHIPIVRVIRIAVNLDQDSFLHLRADATP